MSTLPQDYRISNDKRRVMYQTTLFIDDKFIEMSLMVSKNKSGWSYDANIMKPEVDFYGHLCSSKLELIDMVFQHIEEKIKSIGKLRNVTFDFSIKPISTEPLTDDEKDILERYLDKKLTFRKDKRRVYETKM